MSFRSLLCTALCLIAPCVAAEEGYQPLFNGKDLTGWDGDPKHWSVVEAVIRGDSTVNRAGGNTFIIWRGGVLKDFELRLKYRIHTGNNSGVQYRSREVSKWVVAGYQSEVENNLGKTGFLYHERGRGWLVDVGDFMHIDPKGAKAVVGICADRDAVIKAPYHTDKDWNQYHFIARGNHLVQVLNGYTTVELIDEHVTSDPKSLNQRSLEGILALQVHGGSPMMVDFKDIELKPLTAKFGEARRLFNGKDLTGWSGEAKVEPVTAKGYKRPSNAKVEIGGAIALEAGRSVSYEGPTPASYVLRYQVRDGAPAAEGELFKTVEGWRTQEMHVSGDAVSWVTNGKASAAGVAGGGRGKVTLTGEKALAVRNVVLIPME
jgi:hypothetical protein